MYLSKLIYVFLFGLLLTSFLSLLLNQITLFVFLKEEYQQQHQHDLFVLHELCINDDIKNSIGAKYNSICTDVEKNVLISPSFKAFKEVLNRTYLCGSESCSKYISEALNAIKIDWKIWLLIILSAPFVVRYITLGYNNSRNRHQYYNQIDSQIPFHTLPFDQQYYYSIK
jgi:hypothetical protein